MIGYDVMKYDHWLITIKSKDVSFINGVIRKTIKCTEKATVAPYAYVSGYLQALHEKGVDVDKLDVSIRLESNDGRFAEIMPSPKFEPMS
tara:strand:- start:347 stop:616 length:270 start_codon:yes stop_codon:yes gene_type:complete